MPTLYLVAEGDTALPLSGMYELFERTPATKRTIILHRADHSHFMDQVEQLHEMFRTMPDAGDLAAIQKEMRPMAEFCSEEQAHLFVRGLTTHRPLRPARRTVPTRPTCRGPAGVRGLDRRRRAAPGLARS